MNNNIEIINDFNENDTELVDHDIDDENDEEYDDFDDEYDNYRNSIGSVDSDSSTAYNNIKLEIELLEHKQNSGLSIDLEEMKYLQEKLSNHPLHSSNESTDNYRNSIGSVDSDSSTSYNNIKLEIELLEHKQSSGIQIDMSELNYFHEKLLNHPKHQSALELAHNDWIESNYVFLTTSLSIMRSYIPVDIFSKSLQSLIADGLNEELAKRIMRKQSLWIVRLSSHEISMLHEADLYGRYNTSGENFDIVELSAIYQSLPEKFSNDLNNKKNEWKLNIETTLKRLLADKEKGVLSVDRIRNPAYPSNVKDEGPYKDRSSVRINEIVKGYRPNALPRKSFLDICKKYSILSPHKIEK